MRLPSTEGAGPNLPAAHETSEGSGSSAFFEWWTDAAYAGWRGVLNTRTRSRIRTGGSVHEASCSSREAVHENPMRPVSRFTRRRLDSFGLSRSASRVTRARLRGWQSYDCSRTAVIRLLDPSRTPADCSRTAVVRLLSLVARQSQGRRNPESASRTSGEGSKRASTEQQRRHEGSASHALAGA